MKIIFIVIFIGISQFGSGQTFETVLVPGTGNSMVQSLDGGFVITGSQGAYLLLTKADSTGQQIWSKTYGDAFGMTPHNQGFDILLLADGGFMICGYYNPSTATRDAYLIRTDENGDSLWTKHFSSPFLSTDEYYFFEIKQNSFGEFIVGGQIQYDSTQPFDIVLMKLDSMGNEVWHRELDLGKKEIFKGLEITDSSYTIIGESYYISSPIHDHFIVRTDTSGFINFSRLYSQSPCCDEINDLILKANQNYIIVGYHNDTLSSYIDFFEFNYSGDTLQYNSILNPLQIPVSGFFEHTNGYIIYGYKRTGLVDDAFVIKVDKNGNELWRKLYGGNGNDELYSGLLTMNGNFAFSGRSNSFGPSSVYLLVTDTSGSLINIVNPITETNDPFEFLLKNEREFIIDCNKNVYGPVSSPKTPTV